MYGDDRRQSRSGCSIIFFILLITVTAIGLYYWLFTGRVPKRLILEADFEQGMIEHVPDDGLARDWPAPATGVETHHGYAFQWFALSALITGLYVWFQLIRPRRRQPL